MKGGSEHQGRTGSPLPGVSYLLPTGLRKAAAAVAAHAGEAKGGTWIGSKGTTAVAPGINAFLTASSTPGMGVASDGRLGSGAVNYKSGTYTIPDSVGTQIGGNLFESFSQFNLLQGEIADFQGPSSVQNILARVTGGSASSIDGTIESDIQGANLFLINPAGVIFGPAASLNVSGAFTVSTANYVVMADGGKFNANAGVADMLTSAPVSAFGFVNSAPAPVSFGGSQLSLPADARLNVIAGNVTLDGATLSAPSGGITVFSTASAGVVPFSLTAPGAGYAAASSSALGTVSLGEGSLIAIGGADGGAMVIRAGVLSVDDSIISSLNYGSADGGDLNFSVAGALTIEEGGKIIATTASAGNGGNVIIQAGSMDIDGSATPSLATGIALESDQGAMGNAGNLNMTVTDALNIESSEIIALTASGGNGGNVTIRANSLNLDGLATPDLLTRIAVYSDLGAAGNPGDLNITVAGVLAVENGAKIATNSESSGNAGDLVIQAGSLDIQSGGIISAIAFSSGNGGNATVQAGSMNINGSATPDLITGILAESYFDATGNAGALNITVAGALDIEGGGEIAANAYSSGEGGNMVVRAGSLDIDSNGEIAAATFSAGKGGNLTVEAGALTIDGLATPGLFTGIATQTNDGASGNAGNLKITVTGALDITNSGEISADTFTSGNGGNVDIEAGSLNIDGAATPAYVTGIGSQSDGGATGNAGNLVLDVSGAITIQGEGIISATTHSSGIGGSLTVRAGSLDIEGANGYPVGIVDGSETDQDDPGDIGGDAGPLRIVVRGSLTLEGDAEIDTNTYTPGNAGDVAVSAHSILIEGQAFGTQASISADANKGATGAGGKVTIDAGNIVVRGGGEIDTDSNDSKEAGGVTVSAESILIDGESLRIFTGLSADANEGATGAGGRVTINTGNLTIRGGGRIETDTYDNENAGDLTVNAGSLSILGDPNVATEITSDTYSGGNAGDVSVSAQTILIKGESQQTFTGIAAESNSGATGDGGNVAIGAGMLLIEGGGQVSASTFSSGNGGAIAVTAQDVIISGFASFPSGIFSGSALAQKGGAAGGISIRCDNLTVIAEGEVAADAFAANAGDVSVDAVQNVTLEDQGIISSSAGVNGGNVNIRAGSLLYLLDSSIYATAGSTTAANGKDANAANGGNITIDPRFIVLNDSLISANAAVGQGGNIVLESTYYLNSASAITATGATSGTITITSPELDLSGALAGLPSSPVGSQTQLQETCAMAIQGDFSSFLSVGQGDVEAAPDEAQGGIWDGGEHPAHRTRRH